MKISKLAILTLFVLSIFSCSYDSEGDLIEAVDPIDPNTVVTYTDNVETIIQNACVGCHASPPVNGAPFSLINFEQVNLRASAMLNRMSLQSGAAGAMPPSGRLPQATIDVFEQWIDDGKLED